MKTRFDSLYNKPSKLTVVSKAKVLEEYKQLQQDLQTLKNPSQLAADELAHSEMQRPEPPALLKKHLRQNPNILTKSETNLLMDGGY